MILLYEHEKWETIKEFLSVFMFPNVFFHYLYFIFSLLEVIGLFLFWKINRKKNLSEEKFKISTRYEMQKKNYSLVFAASVLQFVLCLILILTLPSGKMSWDLMLTIFTGVFISLPAMYWIYKAIAGLPENIEKNFKKVVICLIITISFMGLSSCFYYYNSLTPDQKLTILKTENILNVLNEAKKKCVFGDTCKHPELEKFEIDESLGDVAKGAAIFKQNCSPCHGKDVKVVGPPLTEIISLYHDNAEGLKQWIKTPGKKRANFSQMPTLSQLTDDDRNEIAKYILSIK